MSTPASSSGGTSPKLSEIAWISTSACDGAGVPLFEDDPYRDLVYDACARRPVVAGLRRSPWIYQGSFSKSLAPGLRLGFLTASPETRATTP